MKTVPMEKELNGGVTPERRKVLAEASSLGDKLIEYCVENDIGTFWQVGYDDAQLRYIPPKFQR